MLLPLLWEFPVGKAVVDLNGDLVIFLNLEFDSMIININDATFYLLCYIIFYEKM